MNKILFKIPVYQRNYDWPEDNCKKLMEDIKNVIDTGKIHFLGTIVYMPNSETSLVEDIIVDGQQRLTTLMILIKALADVAHENNDLNNEDEILHSYLYNMYCDEQFKIKLKPIKSDDIQFKFLLENSFDKMNKESHVYKNYNICKKYINSFIDEEITIKDILESLACKLEIVGISLTKGEDDPQAIFESINSTGLDLSNSDLIRNFLLMDAENQEYLYEKYWLSIEEKLKNDSNYYNLNNFFYHYILFKSKKEIVKEDKLYQSFVCFYKENNYTKEEMLKELEYYSNIYSSFIYDKEDYPTSITRYLKSFRKLDQTTCYPFLFCLFDDYENKVITEDILNKTLKLILIYLLRRLICGVSTNSLRSLFVYLYNRVFKISKNKQKYYEAINKFLFSLNSKDTMPSEIEFENQLKQFNFYRTKNLCRFILENIENQNGKEVINTNNLTIEHIMPRNLGINWKNISQEEHEQYLNTIGNLTITGYNSELSNKSFIEKKEIIKEYSKAVKLNQDIIDKNVWNIETIKSRTDRLVEIIKNMYYVEKIEDDNISFIHLSNMTLDDIDNVTGKQLVSFTYNGKKYHQNKFKYMFQDMIKLFDEENPEIFPKLASENFYNFIFNKKYSNNFWNLRDEIFVKTNLSARHIISALSMLMEKLKIDENKFSFSVLDKNKEGDDFIDYED